MRRLPTVAGVTAVAMIVAFFASNVFLKRKSDRVLAEFQRNFTSELRQNDGFDEVARFLDRFAFNSRVKYEKHLSNLEGRVRYLSEFPIDEQYPAVAAQHPSARIVYDAVHGLGKDGVFSSRSVIIRFIFDDQNRLIDANFVVQSYGWP